MTPATPPHDPVALGQALLRGFRDGGDPRQLRRAAALLVGASAGAAERGGPLGGSLLACSEALYRCFQDHGVRADLRQAIRCGDAGLSAGGGPAGAATLGLLARAHLDGAELAGPGPDRSRLLVGAEQLAASLPAGDGARRQLAERLARLRGPEPDQRRADLCGELRDRIERYAASADASEVLAGSAVLVAYRLLRVASEPDAGGVTTVGSDAVQVLSWFWWHRFLLLPDGDEQEDFAGALAGFRLLLAHGVGGPVPPPVRGVLESELAGLVAQAGALLAHHAPGQPPEPALVDKAIAKLSRAPAGDGPGPAAEAAGMLAGAHQLRHRIRHDPADLDRAVDGFRLAAGLAVAGPDPAELDRWRHALATALAERYAHRHESTDRDDAIEALRAALAGRAPGDPGYPQRAVLAATLLDDRFRETRRLADLDAAIDLAGAAAGTAAAGEDRLVATATVGRARLARFHTDHRPDDLDAAIDALTAVTGAIGTTDPPFTVSVVWSELGDAHADRYGLARRPADADAAITAYRAARDAAGGAGPSADLLWRLLRALNWRLGRTQSGEDLAAAAAVARDLVGTATTDDPRWSRYHATAGAMLLREYEHGRGDALDEALAVLRAGHRPGAAPDDLLLDALATGLRHRYQRDGDHRDLDEAAAAHRDVLDRCPPERSSRARGGLGATLVLRFNARGDPGDLDEAITSLREALRHLGGGTDEPDDDGELRASAHTDLGAALLERHQRFGATADLDEAVEVYRVGIPPPGSGPARAAGQHNLFTALFRRFEVTGDTADLDAAATAARAAVDGPHDGNGPLAAHLSGLALAQVTRAEHGDGADGLDEAVDLAGQAVGLATGGWQVGISQVTLGRALLNRWLQLGDPSDVDAATRALRAALDTLPPDGPSRAEVLRMLALAQQADPATDPSEAIALLRAAAEQPTAITTTRIDAARGWGAAAERAGPPGAGLAGYTTALSLLPQAAWRGMDHTDQQRQLGRWLGLAGDAAACALNAGDPDRALELLEQGRAVLWSRMLETRTELDTLAAAHPALADQLGRVRGELDRSPPEGPGGTDRRAELARDWDALLDQVRALDGFGDFLRPPRAEQLRAATAGGTAVVLNASDLRCDALVVTPDRIRVVPLRNLTFDDLFQATNTTLLALQAIGLVRTLPLRVRAESTVTDLLGWLWDVVAEPVLGTIGIAGPPSPGHRWPRVWWCPTGPLTMLPIHAAGHPRPGRSVLDRVVSSYLPTLATLVRARRAGPPPDAGGLVTVAMPETRDRRPLPSARDEAARIAAGFPGGAVELVAEQATVARVAAELRRHPYAHLACHSGQDLTDPSSGRIVLHDGGLSVLDLARQRLAGAELAFLSSCQTAAGGVRVLDEAIHLAAACQLAGYRHVIGTLWSVPDETTGELAVDVWRRLVAGGTPDAGRAAEALHHAQRALRDRQPAWPITWAPYLHTGP